MLPIDLMTARLILRAKSFPSPCLWLALILSSYQTVSSRLPPGISMTRHEHRGSTIRSTAAAQSAVANDGCLSSRADFIPSWLNHMQNDPPPDIPKPKSPLDSNNLSWHPNGLKAVRIQLNSGTGQYQSSDIFIQDSPSSPPPIPRCHHHHPQPALDSDANKNLHDGERHNHATRPASMTSEQSLTKNYVFEKQPRRKTRRDRYDTTKSKVGRVDKGHGKKTSTRVSKKGRLRSSRDIMANSKLPAITNPGQKITVISILSLDIGYLEKN